MKTLIDLQPVAWYPQILNNSPTEFVALTECCVKKLMDNVNIHYVQYHHFADYRGGGGGGIPYMYKLQLQKLSKKAILLAEITALQLRCNFDAFVVMFCVICYNCYRKVNIAQFTI